MKDHNDYSVMIQLFIDQELTGKDYEDLLTHVGDCASQNYVFNPYGKTKAAMRGRQIQRKTPHQMPKLRLT